MTRAPDPAGGLRERRKQNTRAALVDAALRLFDERGYADVTVEEICEVAEVSPRTFFRYFPAKEQVLAEPIEALLGRIRGSLAAQPSDRSVWQALRDTLGAAVDLVEARREEFLRSSRIIRETPGLLSSSAGALMEWELSVRDEVAQRLGRPRGDLHPRLLLGTAMIGLRAGLEQWTDGGGTGDVRVLVDRALDLLGTGAEAVEREAKQGARSD